MSKKKDGKITLGMLKGKPVTTSVPSISIKFHANAEQLEELYVSDDEHTSNDTSVGSAGAAGVSEPESSPLKYLPRLVKRSTSIDITPNTTLDASPPSDPWRFFSDIKGKITKSVEEKITEIKARNQEEGSPLKSKAVKDSKDNSSVSDSEDLSESSISKTCGIVSTTEGAEMSSDDDTPSIEKDKKSEEPPKPVNSSSSSSLRQRFRLLKPKSTSKEGTISKRGLASLYNINTDKIEQALAEETDIESAVDALEDSNLRNDQSESINILKEIEDQFDNIKIDGENVVNIKEVSGSDVRQVHWASKTPTTVYAPVGFVDFRVKTEFVNKSSLWPVLILVAFAVSYFFIHRYSNYLAGFVVGVFVTFTFLYVKYLLDTPTNPAIPIRNSPDILQIPAVREFQPLEKYEGWVNEFPETYNPHTYHISQTQSVYLRLQGNLLRISHARNKIPKRALWNEPKIKPVFTHHRIYNLLGAQVILLPEGLAKKRHWSKKYPICLILNKDQMDFETQTPLKRDKSNKSLSDSESHVSSTKAEDDDESSGSLKPKRFCFGGKKKKPQTLRFSKLTEENEMFDLDSENSRASTPSPVSPDDLDDSLPEISGKVLDKALNDSLQRDDEHEVIFDDEFETLSEDWGTFTPPDREESPTQTKLYLFGRTDREKEDWFRRLKSAVHKGANVSVNEPSTMETSVSHTLIDKAMTETDYIKYMLIFNKVPLYSGVEYPNQVLFLHDTTPFNYLNDKHSKRNYLQAKKAKNSSNESSIGDASFVDIQWINAFMGRVLFDCLQDNTFTQRVKDKIQKKLSSIKLPYFIEGLVVTELSLGHTPPLIHKASKPMIDERGLWIDLDIMYEGLIVLILQTKLNLMKLKQPHLNDCSRSGEKSAMFHSDVEDSAESTSDEEAMCVFQNNSPVLDASGIPVQGLGGSSNTSKKFMKMVDKIAESKFFQAATEYRYIKKAMEGVSNTELRLKVEVKELIGTLVLNIPPPPTDRVWIGFRPTPALALSAQPIVGERNITYLRITSWIEKKLLLEFQKLMVIPNMEDFIVPVMSPKLPD